MLKQLISLVQFLAIKFEQGIGKDHALLAGGKRI
jgi:hypothetical protein